MKTILGLFLLVLTSCGTSLERPKSNTDYKNIIGMPIKIGNIEVAQYDFPDPIGWVDANKACAELGDGWRLPTKDELKTLYQNKNEIGNFVGYCYWSSTVLYSNYVWSKPFYDDSQTELYISVKLNVRAVRAF